MSTRWPGGIISQTAPVPSGPYANSTAPGVWTLEQQAYLKQQGLWPTFGNVNPDAFIENLFSTYLYTGNGAAQTINNGINLTGKGGLVWTKSRSAVRSNNIVDTVRGGDNMVYTDATDAQFSLTGLGFSPFTFSSTGFVASNAPVNAQSGATFCSWTFREQPKFFDVVTYTGNGTAGRTVAHSLGSVPGMIIVKSYGAGETQPWAVYHRSLGATKSMRLNSTIAEQTSADKWNNTEPTSTNFTVGSDFEVNSVFGFSYVAYLFAHDAGGFGTAGTDNVISCGGFTSDGSGNATINLGYEPQYVMYKRSSGTSDWLVFDVMRGMSLTSGARLNPNTSTAESANLSIIPTATGFNLVNFFASSDYIYMAIRRPMAVPTVGTQVFNPVYGQSGAPGFRSSNFNAGMDTSFVFLTSGYNDGTNAYQNLQTRLTGTGQLQTGNSRAEVSQSYNTFDYMNGQNNTTFYSPPWGSWLFKRAPGFHDVVCYTGNGGYVSRNHNLAAVPEMMIVKARSAAGYNWAVYHSALGIEQYMRLNTTGTPSDTGNFWYLTPTTTQFSTGGYADIEETGVTYVAYLFATLAGISKVGSYTGTGATQTINAGLPTGARFVLIKRTDAAGDWYVWDTTRGMVAGTNPSLTLNTYAAEVNANSVYTIATGFQLLASPAVPVNNSGASYIFLAIA